MKFISRLFGKAAAEPEKVAADTIRPERTAGSRFGTDRLFDTDKTVALRQILQTPVEARDLAWAEAFHDAAWSAATMLGDPPVVTGPDGFNYLRLDLPASGTFDANSMGNVAQACVDQGLGVALFHSPDDPVERAAYVFSLGMLDCLLRYDSWDGDPVDVAEAAEVPDPASVKTRNVGDAEQVELKTEQQALLGTPSHDFLSRQAAGAMLKYLEQGCGVADPRFILVMIPSLRPTRSLAFKLDNDPENLARTRQILKSLSWFLPPKRTVMLAPGAWDDRLISLRSFAH